MFSTVLQHSVKGRRNQGKEPNGEREGVDVAQWRTCQEK